jgi:hypothetical protein
MTAYSDVAKVNTLVLEQSNLASGIAILDAGGTTASFTIMPPPASTTEPPPAMPMMSVMVQTIDPPPELMAAARAAMVERHNAISAELEALGVTGAPPMTL